MCFRVYVPACECKFVLMCVHVRRLMDVHVRADTLWMITRANFLAADCYVSEVPIFS